MKRIFTFLFLIAMVSTVFGQMEALVDFEAEEDTAYWQPFANGPGTMDDKSLSITLAPNPNSNEVNGSDQVLKFHVRPDCDNWVGMYADASAPGGNSIIADFAFTDFTAENNTGGGKTIVYMAYKERINECGLKLERSLNAGETTSLYVPNTKTEEWELITFEMPAAVENFYYERLTIFVDHFAESGDRAEDDSTDVYIDNIGIPGSYTSTRKQFEGVEMMLYPTPAEYRMAVVYPGITGITLTDVMGRQIRSMRFGVTDNKVINVGDLSPGIYFVTAETGTGKHTMRFLKK